MTGGGRPKKGLHRIDAAFDALQPWGFAREIIRKTIKDLLKVYGDEGWVFIEEYGYQQVIEAILEKQKEEDQNEERTHGMIEGDDVVTPSAMKMIEPVVDYGETSLLPEGGLGRIEDKLPAAIGYASPAPSPSSSKFHNIAGDSSQKTYPHPDPHVTSRYDGLSNARQDAEVPRQRRPPCYGWISETESSSSEES